MPCRFCGKGPIYGTVMMVRMHQGGFSEAPVGDMCESCFNSMNDNLRNYLVKLMSGKGFIKFEYTKLEKALIGLCLLEFVMFISLIAWRFLL